MQKIDISKKYRTRSGYGVEILKTSLRNSVFPVVAIINTAEKQILAGFTEYGKFYGDGESDMDLVEVSPYEDFVVDEPVMVRDNEYEQWKKAHFAGVSCRGYAKTWQDGETSWTSYDASMLTWQFCRRPTPEELA